MKKMLGDWNPPDAPCGKHLKYQQEKQIVMR